MSIVSMVLMSFSAAQFAAIGLTLAILCGLLVWAWRLYRRTRYTPSQACLYSINYYLNKFMWRTTVSGRLPIAMDAGAVIVSNHRAGIDPFFIAQTVLRPVHWMVAKEYCDYWLLGWFFRVLAAIPTNRAGIDTAATKAAIRLAQSGELVGVFPEGRINRTEKPLLPGRPGAAMIALRARVPVIPCHVHGSPYNGTTFGSMFMRARVRVTVGEPIDISAFYDQADDRVVHEELTKRFLKAIAKLGGVEDLTPELAGRRWKPGMEEEAEESDSER